MDMGPVLAEPAPSGSRFAQWFDQKKLYSGRLNMQEIFELVQQLQNRCNDFFSAWGLPWLQKGVQYLMGLGDYKQYLVTQHDNRKRYILYPPGTS
jgi:hypothetical protein